MGHPPFSVRGGYHHFIEHIHPPPSWFKRKDKD